MHLTAWVTGNLFCPLTKILKRCDALIQWLQQTFRLKDLEYLLWRTFTLQELNILSNLGPFHVLHCKTVRCFCEKWRKKYDDWKTFHEGGIHIFWGWHTLHEEYAWSVMRRKNTKISSNLTIYCMIFKNHCGKKMILLSWVTPKYAVITYVTSYTIFCHCYFRKVIF